MIITKKSQPIEGTVYAKSGHGKKEKDVPLFIISIPTHDMVYDPAEDALLDEPVEVEVYAPLGNELVKVAAGTWPLETFSGFVDGVRAVTEAAVPYIRDCEDFVAHGKISGTTYVWSRFEREKVAGGFMREDKHEYIQKVKYSLFDRQFEWARWESEMLDSLISIRDEVADQRRAYLEEMRSKIGRSLGAESG